MEMPIQVAVQICPCYPNEPCCVHTVPQYVDSNANKLSLAPANSQFMGGSEHSGLVYVSTSAAAKATDSNHSNGQQSSSYAIQHALPYGCSQEYVYRKSVHPLIAMFLEGYDTSIVTYGQHGTGKTYTMYGPGFDCVYGESEQGIVQRSVRDIFAHLTRRQRECRYSINVAWVEICGNEIHDILGGRVVQCINIGDVFQCLQIGLANRSQEASHSLFTITLEQQWITIDGLIQHRLSTASFCDLCGTERIFSVFNQQISVPKDLGLQALERIVATLSDPNFYTLDNGNINLMSQYEDMTLTKLLKDSFGGRAHTLMILCVSPLEQDIVETTHNLHFAYKVQFVRNTVVINTFSDNNVPVSNFIDPMLVTAPQIPVPLPQALHYNPLISINKLNANNQNTFGLKFAASQWLKLVSNAEGLFSKLLVSNKLLNGQDRECIEEWMFLKQECEECLSSGELASNQRLLGPIEETDEPDENSASDGGGGGGITMLPEHPKKKYSAQSVFEKKSRIDSQNESTVNTDNDSDSDDIIQQTEYLEEKIAELMIDFSCKTNKMIEENYDEYIKTNPEAITHSCDAKCKNSPCVKPTPMTSVVAVPTVSGGASGRRRSIQPGSNNDAAMLSSADLEHLQQMADESIRNSQSLSMNNSVCREAAEFLESSNDMHPFRAANANKVQTELLNDIHKIRADIEAKEKQIDELTHNITKMQQIIKELNGPRVKANRRLNQKELKLLSAKEKCREGITNSGDKKEMSKLQAEFVQLEKQLNKVIKTKQISLGSDVTRIFADLQKSKKHLHSLVKTTKKDRKMLERKMLEYKMLELKQEKLKYGKDDKRNPVHATNVDTRITQLDCVLKEKNECLKMNQYEGEKVESIRHEIRNLRSERDRLTEAQCILNQKLKKEKKLSEKESREILEIDVAKEVIDHAMEFKNQLICGRDVSHKTASFMGNPELMSQLHKLNEKEMRILLYKCFQKIVDLRDSSRQLEIQLLQLEKERTDWKLRECALYNEIRQSQLEAERHTLHLQQQYETKLTRLLQIAGEDSSTLSNNSSMIMAPSARAEFLHMIPATKGQTAHQQHHQYLDMSGNFFDSRNPQSSSSKSHNYGANHHYSYHYGEPQELIAVATTSASSKHQSADLVDTYQKHKVKSTKFLTWFKGQRTHGNVTDNPAASKQNMHHQSLMLANQLSPATNQVPEPKVTKIGNKIFIQQNK